MLADLHTTIQTLIYDRGRIPADQVDITFEMPTREWLDARLRPTINLFLFEIEENTDLRQTGVQTTRGDGRAIHRMPPRRFDLRYMVSALSTVIADEHALIWRTLAALLRDAQIAPQLLAQAMSAILRREGFAAAADIVAAEAGDPRLKHDLLRAFIDTLDVPAEIMARLHNLASDPPLATKIVKSEQGPRSLDLWGAVELPPRPALLYVVTAPLELDIATEAPLVLTSTVRTRRAADVPLDVSIRIGGVVRDTNGQPLAGIRVGREGSAIEDMTDKEGRFILDNVPSGSIKLWAARGNGAPKIVTIEIPSASYDISLE
jgi:hypothetical protein